MKNKIVNTLLLLFFWVGSNQELHSADTNSVYVGPLIGYGFSNQYNIMNHGFSGDPYCNLDKDFDKAEDYYVGIHADYDYHRFEFLELVNAIGFSISYSHSENNYKSGGDVYPDLVNDPQDPEEVSIIRSYTQVSTLNKFDFINLELIYKLKYKYIGIGVGPYISYLYSTHSKVDYSIVSPDNNTFTEVKGYEYSDDLRTVHVYNDEMENMESYYYGVMTSVFAEYDFCDNFRVAAYLNYGYPLSGIMIEQDWAIERISYNLVLSYFYSNYFLRFP